jgi:hypothetical protein
MYMQLATSSSFAFFYIGSTNLMYVPVFSAAYFWEEAHPLLPTRSPTFKHTRTHSTWAV